MDHHGALTDGQIDAAIRGDRAAVTALTQEFLPRVFGLTLRMTRQRELAEEATQETFVRALKALPKLRERTRLKSWILTIAANTARELGRKQSRTASLDYEPPAVDAEEDDVKAARQKALDHAVTTLRQDERELFLLHTVEGVKLRELADEHETTVPAMKSRVHRIRAKIRVAALERLQQAGVALA